MDWRKGIRSTGRTCLATFADSKSFELSRPKLSRAKPLVQSSTHEPTSPIAPRQQCTTTSRSLAGFREPFRAEDPGRETSDGNAVRTLFFDRLASFEGSTSKMFDATKTKVFASDPRNHE